MTDQRAKLAARVMKLDQFGHEGELIARRIISSGEERFCVESDDMSDACFIEFAAECKLMVDDGILSTRSVF